KKHVANRFEIDSGFGRGTRNTPWQWRTTWGKFGATFEEYRDWVLSYEPAELNFVSKKTGISAEKIEKAAEIIAKPINGKRPKTSFALEKGNYWSNNYTNTTSYASLGLICGAGNRPGRVISRLGGHQRGWISAAAYPRMQSPEKFSGRRKKEIDLDRWVEAGKLRFAWVIGTTWTAAMAASEELAATFRKLTKDNTYQVNSLNRKDILETLKARVDSGGMVIAHQDIYMRYPMGTEFADFILPGSGWGESDFTRCNGERRLRLFSKFYDPPGEAKPDWWIISRFAQQMGFKDYDWKDANQVFEEAARFSRDGVLNYHPLVVYAKKLGMRGHDLLREFGTDGIQTPIRFRTNPTESKKYLAYAGYYNSPLIPGVLVGTKKLHDSTLDPGVPEGPTVHKKWLTKFNTHSGKAILHKSPWEIFSDFYERITPKGDELWVTSGRINEIWQSAYDDIRRPYIVERWPDNFIEIHPQDASARGIESGDFIEIVNNDVLIQTGGFVGVDEDDLSYTKLQEKGLIRIGKGSLKAVAMVTEAIRPGVVFSNFLHTHSTANSLVHRVPDPLTNRYRFKLGKGRIRKIGESPYKKSLQEMTFKPRTVMPEKKLSLLKQDEDIW
ncbi:molybdopterin-dependent oxidoreductase, partial [PVC group bacterium]|nr:molybdopterin-dependent oxidoreductase [PVC group bacterium]